MAKGQQRSNREAKKPKKEQPKNAIPVSRSPSAGGAGVQPKPDRQKR